MRSANFVEEINNAVGAHGMWKMRLRTAVRTGRCEIHSSIACCDDQCAFGKWLLGPDFDARTQAGMPYQVVKRLHAEFHKCAGSVLSYVERGNAAAGQFILDGEFTERSDKLVRALTKWKNETLHASITRRHAA